MHRNNEQMNINPRDLVFGPNPTYPTFPAKGSLDKEQLEKIVTEMRAKVPVSPSFQQQVHEILAEIEKLLVDKNRKYGNSALEPKRVFSKASAVEQIKVRLDDKLSRIANQQNDEDEDVVTDIIGYLVILKIALRK